MEMTRSFPGMFTKGRGKRRFPAATLVPAKRPKPMEVAFHLLPKTYEKTPTGPEQLVHLQAGLGRRTANLDESTTHNELCHTLKVVFPKLEKITCGWLLYKPAGGWGTRTLSLVEPDDTGYTGKIIKAANRGGRSTFFIAPMQEELDTTPLLLTDEAFSSMHKATCQKCGAAIPLQLLTEHIKSCNISDESLAVVEDSCEQEWLTVQDPTRAISQFRDDVLSIHESKNPLLLSMDIRSSPAEQDAALICFYKKPNVEWGRPLKCRLEGDAVIGEGVSRFFFSTCMDKLNSGFCINFANTDGTRLFDGEPGH
nr:uncharacterized protein LOC117447545 isoform X1 [Pseudochaenichthys georgianus]